MKNIKSRRLSNLLIAQLRRAVTPDSGSANHWLSRGLICGGVAFSMLTAGSIPAEVMSATTLDTAVAVAQDSSVDEAKATDERTIAFAYQEEDWDTVIKDFVAQTGMTLFPYSDYPDGSFTYPDGKSHTLKEGLDILNHNLLLKGFVLIRFGDQLILVNHVEDGFPDPLIEQVSPDDLEERGMFDLVYTRFDVKGLDLAEITDQVTDLIDPQRGKVVPIEAAKEIRVRENVRVLLTVKSVIEKAKASKKATFKMKNLEFIPYEILMRIVRPEFELDETTNRSKDGSLSVALGSGESQIWVTGEADRVESFMTYVEQLDVKEFQQAEGQTAEYRLDSYSPATDPAVAYKIIMNVFDGRSDMRIALSEESGVIYVSGREQDHELIAETLKTIAADGMQLAVIQCNVLDTDEMIDYIKNGLGMSTGSLLDDEKPAGNVKLYFLEDSLNDKVFLRGTLPLITAAKEIADAIDPPRAQGAKESKPYVRISVAEDQDLDAAIREFEMTWGGSVDRPNKVEIVAPSERGGYSGSAQEEVNSNFRFPSWERQRGSKLDVESLTPEQINQLRKMLLEDAKKADEEFKVPEANETKDSAAVERRGNSIGYRSSINPIVGAYVSTSTMFQETVAQEGEQDPEKKSDTVEGTVSDQKPTPIFKHEPGAPIFIERSASGEITLRSNDREALAIAADLMSEILQPGIEGDPIGLQQRVTFLIGFRSAEELAGEIEAILGLDGGGGGGGGGDLMSNMAQNMVGGPAGDMLGGLLGGGSGGGSSSDLTTGDVAIHVDNFLNALIVYANETDLAEIESLIQLKDRPTAPHDPLVNGETRVIKIMHRDPEVIKTQVETIFADIIRKPEAANAGGGQPQPNPAELIKQMMGGRGGRGGAGGAGGGEAAKPKISVSVDTEAKLLLVVGPGNLCDQVEQFVRELDFEGALPQKRTEIVPVPSGLDIEMLKTVFPNAVQASGTAGAGGAKPATPTPGTPGGATGSAPSFNLPANFGGFGNRGGNTGGNRGGNRGGGNRGGGGRGGRGGR